MFHKNFEAKFDKFKENFKNESEVNFCSNFVNAILYIFFLNKQYNIIPLSLNGNTSQKQKQRQQQQNTNYMSKQRKLVTAFLLVF